MEKDQIILLENRGLILISGEDAKNFLQNIITNDIEKVSLFCACSGSKIQLVRFLFFCVHVNKYLIPHF